MRRWVALAVPVVVVALLTVAITCVVWHRANGAMPTAQPIAAQFTDESLFLSPIKQAAQVASSAEVTGITVPHHLLARDLIARAFKFSANRQPRQIVVVSPDHFNLGDTNVSTTTRNVSTVFGTLVADSELINNLLRLPFVRNQDFFYREHGVQAELPFIKFYFPNAQITIITFKESTPKTQVSQVVDTLKQHLSTSALLVQSTDFSHYLTPSNAAAHDTETIAALKSGNPDTIFSLNQPDNLDSTASQYVQTRLQHELFHANLQLLDHKNSQDYTTDTVTSSTSYIVQAYTRNQ